MPDFSRPSVRMSLAGAADLDEGAWEICSTTAVELTVDLAPVVWLYENCVTRYAREIRVDMLVQGEVVGQVFDIELWAQPQAKGGGVRVWSGTASALAEGLGEWRCLGAGVGPMARAWGILARRTAGPITMCRASFKLSGWPGGTLGTIVRGEGVVP